MAQIWTVESLATLTDEGRPRPSLAKDWTVSPDGLSLTVNLASNLKFHDGSPLTAAVVADALRAMLPNTMGPAFEDVEGVSAVNDQQVDPLGVHHGKVGGRNRLSATISIC